MAGQEPEKTRPWPSEAVRWAANDILTIPQPVRPYIRYVWLYEPTERAAAEAAFTLNSTVNQSATLLPLHVVGNNWLLRFSLAHAAPEEKDFSRIVDVWESQFDPDIHVRSVVEEVIDRKRIKTEWYTSSIDGKRYNHKWKEIKRTIETVAFSVATNHDNGEAMTVLAAETKSAVPIVSQRHFQSTALTTNGGLYYKWLGFDQNPGKQTDQEFILSLFGASEKQVAKLKSDERTATWFSKVTAKPRRADFFFGTAARPSTGYPLITITHDIRDGKVDPKAHPMKNLLKFDDDAREVLAQRPNGTLAGWLTDDSGVLQDVVPPDIAKNHTAPEPQTGNLQAVLDCYSCHGPHDGWQPFPNDVQAMLGDIEGHRRANILDDEGSREGIYETLDRLAGLYSGNLNEPLRLARNTYERTCYNIAHSMELPSGKPFHFHALPGDYAKTLMGNVVESTYSYLYDPVTPAMACRDLGYEVDEEEGAEVFRRLVPLTAPNRFNVSGEDATFMALRSWSKEHPLVIRREDWNHVKQDALLRHLTATVKGEFP